MISYLAAAKILNTSDIAKSEYDTNKILNEIFSNKFPQTEENVLQNEYIT